MNNGELIVSAETLTRIFIFLLYALVVLISYWRLMPRLPSTSKRLASAMLAAQVLIIIVKLEIRPDSAYENWLWNLSAGENIPVTFSTTQLVLVGGIALMTAWIAKARPAWHRLYLVGIGLVFLFLATDEYLMIREGIRNWEYYYTSLGTAVVAATAVVAVRSPRRAWIWHLCLLTGLAMTAAGGIWLDSIDFACGSLGFLRLNECLQLFWFEETLEFLGIWVTLLAVLGHFSAAVPAPGTRVKRLMYTLPALWIFLLLLHALVPRLELQHLAQPAAIQFESGVRLHGYRIDSEEETAHIQLYTYVRQRNYFGFGFRVSLVDQASGESVASSNRLTLRPGFWLFGPDYMSIRRQQIEVKIPPRTPANRALWVVLAVWHRRGNVSQKIITSDHQLLDDTQVVLGELVLPAAAAVDGRP